MQGKINSKNKLPALPIKTTLIILAEKIPRFQGKVGMIDIRLI